MYHTETGAKKDEFLPCVWPEQVQKGRAVKLSSIVVTFDVLTRSKRKKPAENGIFAPFIYKNDHFAKTGSGQT